MAVNRLPPMVRSGVVGVSLALVCGVQSASAQWRPARPDDPVRVEAWHGEAGIRIRLLMEDGWYIYGVDAERIGLPLQVLPAEGEERLSLSPLEPAEITTVEGRTLPIHRGRADFLARLPHGGVGGEVRVRWAACRGDICIPRESRVRVDEARLTRLAMGQESLRDDLGAVAEGVSMDGERIDRFSREMLGVTAMVWDLAGRPPNSIGVSPQAGPTASARTSTHRRPGSQSRSAPLR
jgi:hypothetical protein